PVALLHYRPLYPLAFHSFPTRRSSDLNLAHSPERLYSRGEPQKVRSGVRNRDGVDLPQRHPVFSGGRLLLEKTGWRWGKSTPSRSEEHTSELQSRENIVCRLLLEKKKR